MEYAKDISIKLNDGQARKKGNSSKILKRLRKHKIIATITIATIGLIIVDIMLISSFINVLAKI